MEQNEAGLKTGLGQVRVELAQVVRHHQALVGDQGARQAADVEGRIVLEPVFDLLAAQVKQGVEALGGDQLPGGDKRLDDLRQALPGVVAESLGVDRHFAVEHHPQVVVLADL